MSENAPEPMFQYEFSQLATYENGRTPVLLTESQYCRAKSCIDACAGMTSEQVSHGLVSASVFSSVVQRRDDLLAAAEAAMQCIGEMGPTKPRVEVFVMLQDAIAAAKPKDNESNKEAA